MTHSTDPFVSLSFLLCISAFLIAVNAFFVAAEFSIVKVRRTRIEELIGQGVSTAKITLICINELDQILSATQFGITLASLALGWIGEDAFANLLTTILPNYFDNNEKYHHVIALTISFLSITFLHTVLGEIVPKSIAIQNPEKVVLLITRPLRVFYQISRPMIFLFTNVANFILHRFGYQGFEEEPYTEQELKLVMEDSKQEGVISDSEAQIITRAFEFADKRVVDLMVHLEKIDFLSTAKTLEENLQTIKKNMHTRFPLCKKDFNEVIGIVHMKDVWPTLLTEFSNRAFEKSCRTSIFVPSSLRQDQLLKLFQSCRAHMAIVQDTEGKNIGIVTMEDVLESLVGDIRDEYGN